MKAVVLENWGNVDQFQLKDIPVPQITDNEILIKVKAVSINPVDYKTRQGKGVAGRMHLPVILGWDISGKIEAVGQNVVKFKPGDEVFGLSAFPGQAGAYAEYAKADPAEFTFKPETISHEEAAGYPLVALTALQALYRNTDIGPGKRVFIQAAAGGVGHVAVQLAKLKGAYVIGTASSENESFLKSLGIDEVIDYKKVNFEDAVKEVDIVLDGMGGDIAIRSLKCIKPGGTLVSLPSQFKDDHEAIAQAKAKGTSIKWMLVHPSGEDMDEIAQLIKQGKLKINIDKAFPLSQVGEAHQAVETYTTRGKVVLTLD